MEFKHIQGLTPDGTVYYNEDMGTLEAMVPPGKYSTAHAPALLELENGDMLCAWFAGSFEGTCKPCAEHITVFKLKKCRCMGRAVFARRHHSLKGSHIFIIINGSVRGQSLNMFEFHRFSPLV